MTDNAALLESMERRADTTHLMAAYFEGLKSEGYVEGQNVAIEYRWASGVLDRMPAMLADLARLQPDVIVAFGTAARIAAAARRAGTAGTAPIVLSIGTGPTVAHRLPSLISN